MPSPMITSRKSLAATLVVVICLVLIGVAGVAQTAHSNGATTNRLPPHRDARMVTRAGLRFARRSSPCDLHRVTGDRYDCTGYDAADKTRTLHIRVSDSGAAWRSIDDTDH